jgi:hypothetical protein
MGLGLRRDDVCWPTAASTPALISAEALLESDRVSRQPGESRYVNFTDPNFLGGRRSAWSAGPGRVVYYQCLTPEQEERRKRTLVYKWGGGVCTESISVMWSSDEHGALTHVDGGYYGACL